MAIRLSFDVIGSTCGDLLRFADAVRASGTSPGVPLQQGGPNRIDIVDDRRGPEPMPTPMPPFAQPSPLGHPRPLGHPGPPVSGYGYLSGPSYEPPRSGPPSYEPPRRGGSIEINLGGRPRRTDLSAETVVELRAMLGRALDATDLDEPVRAALRNLREAFSDLDAPGGS